ncbi:PAS domain S-box protein [Halorussus halophilus]|uniref:PAS domain S-box protein n=1 Tax=Halorussus halophilus TaxID=2650975 RepID=UPI001301757D|nr:PAS domain S-box protein [Halorussus halophilus]
MNSRSEEEINIRRHIRQQEVVTEIGQQALETEDLDQLLQDAAAAVAETLNADYCKVLQLLPDRERLRLRQGVGWQDGLIGSATVPTGTDSQAVHTLRTKEPVVVDDLATEERFSGPDLLVEHDVISGISVIIGSFEDPWGILGVHTKKEREFTESDVTFVQNVANILASKIENRRTERRLEAEKQVKARILETSPVGIVIVGEAGTIQFANERAEEIYGRSKEELESFSHDDSRWDLVDINGNPLSADEAPFRQVRETGDPIFDMELGLRRPDGQRVWVSVNGSPLDADGEERSAIFAFTDITERVRIEGEFEEILRRITDAFYAVDEEFCFTHVNERAEELLQHSQEELVGEQLWDVFPTAAEIDEVWDAFHTARDEQVSTSYELYYDTLDFWVEANLYPSETGISVYFRDISDRVEREKKLKETIEKLEQSNEQLENFASMLAHEIRNPVAIGQIYSQQLPEAADSQAVDYVSEAFDRIEEMVDVMLLLTRGQGSVGDRKPISVDDVVREVWQTLDTRDATLTVDIDDEILADETYTQHLFRNLLENAVKHGGADASVRVERLPTGFYVADDGHGIPPEDREAVFEEGFTTTCDGEGSGLGLAFVREMSDVYEWECTVSESASGGAQIEFRDVEFVSGE